MIRRIRDKLAQVRKHLWEMIRERHDAHVGGKRRKALGKLVRDVRSEKEEIAVALVRARAGRQLSLRAVKVSTSNWGGSGSVMDQFIEPFMVKRGLPLGSGKRTPAYNASIGGSPTSDHLTTKTLTDARDFPTYAGEDDARALAAAMGNSSWSQNSYASFYITVGDYSFRVQIIWGSGVGHSDHVHTGVSRV